MGNGMRWRRTGRANLLDALTIDATYRNIDIALYLADLDERGQLTQYGAGNLSRGQFDKIISETKRGAQVQKALNERGQA